MHQLTIPYTGGLQLRQNAVQRLRKMRLEKCITDLTDGLISGKTVQIDRTGIPVQNAVLQITDKAGNRLQEASYLANFVVLLGLTLLYGPPFANVSEDQHNADDFAVAVKNGGGAVIDRHFCSIPREENRVIGQPDYRTLSQHPRDRVLDSCASGFVDDTKDLIELLPGNLSLRPFDQRHGDLIREPHASFCIRRNNRISDTRQRGFESLPLSPFGVLCLHGPCDCPLLRATQESHPKADYYKHQHRDLIVVVPDQKRPCRLSEKVGARQNRKHHGQHAWSKPPIPCRKPDSRKKEGERHGPAPHERGQSHPEKYNHYHRQDCYSIP